MSDTTVTDPMLTLTVLGAPPLEARRLRIEERTNQIGCAVVDVTSSDPGIDLDGLLGREAAITAFASTTGAPLPMRTLSGVIRRARLARAVPNGASRYVLEIVPRLWLLSQRRTYRVFQVMSEPEIALQILGEWKIPIASKLDLSRYPRREMRVQYAESDLEMVSRMLEQAGITWTLHPIDGVTTVVLDDAPASAALSIRLPYYEAGTGVAPELGAEEVSIRRRLRPGRYTARDLDLRMPPDRQPLATFMDATATALEQTLERFHFLPGTFHVGVRADGTTPVADERIAARADLAAGNALVERRLAAKRADAKTLAFTSSDARIAPGWVLEIVGHPSRELGEAKRWLAIETHLDAGADGRPRVRVAAVPADRPYRPPLRTPEPVVDSVEPAWVVARSGEEIDPNESGDVRVHFPWERADVVGSGWVPVSQPWAGQGFGVVNIPRHGHEVLVDFFGGSPDRPVITGRTYNATEPVPYTLPANKTQSGWRTSSTGGGGGYNELMMEDAQTRELLRMHAQKNLSTTVLNDERREVDNDRTATVGRDDSRVVKRDQSLSVGGNVQKIVRGTNDTLVGDSQTNVVAQSFRSSVSENRSEYTTSNSSAIVGNDDLVTIDGKHDITGTTSSTFTVGGTSIKMTSSSITMQTAGGAKAVFEPGKIEIKCDIMSVSAEGTVKMTAPYVSFSENEASLDGFAFVDVSGPLVSLNGAGRPFSRLMSLAPSDLRDGAVSVQIGGE